MSRFRIEQLDSQRRTDFDCGNASLNEYLQRHAGQDQRRRYAVCFLAVEIETDIVAGYFTLSSGVVDLGRLPDHLAKRLPRYPAAPVIKLGRLAVAIPFHGTGLARALLADAYTRVLNLEIGAYTIAVDAIDDQAEAFYSHHGFIRLQSLNANDRLLVLPIGRKQA